ncbi:hypothetical protein DFH06DRAFT_1139875 [Mycena polygramma]|nr:hypothetical protein DFH06DRAFT_1139875 [Mycena polygramma]
MNTGEHTPCSGPIPGIQKSVTRRTTAAAVVVGSQRGETAEIRELGSFGGKLHRGDRHVKKRVHRCEGSWAARTWPIPSQGQKNGLQGGPWGLHRAACHRATAVMAWECGYPVFVTVMYVGLWDKKVVVEGRKDGRVTSRRRITMTGELIRRLCFFVWLCSGFLEHIEDLERFSVLLPPSSPDLRSDQPRAAVALSQRNLPFGQVSRPSMAPNPPPASLRPIIRQRQHIQEAHSSRFSYTEMTLAYGVMIILSPNHCHPHNVDIILPLSWRSKHIVFSLRYPSLGESWSGARKLGRPQGNVTGTTTGSTGAVLGDAELGKACPATTFPTCCILQSHPGVFEPRSRATAHSWAELHAESQTVMCPEINMEELAAVKSRRNIRSHVEAKKVCTSGIVSSAVLKLGLTESDKKTTITSLSGVGICWHGWNQDERKKGAGNQSRSVASLSCCDELRRDQLNSHLWPRKKRDVTSLNLDSFVALMSDGNKEWEPLSDADRKNSGHRKILTRSSVKWCTTRARQAGHRPITTIEARLKLPRAGAPKQTLPASKLRSIRLFYTPKLTALNYRRPDSTPWNKPQKAVSTSKNLIHSKQLQWTLAGERGPAPAPATDFS